jgi:hypothetical protein
MYQPLDSCTVDLDDETYETDWRDVGSESSTQVRDGRSAPRHANPTRPKLDRIATSSSVTHQRSLNVTTRLRHPLSLTHLYIPSQSTHTAAYVTMLFFRCATLLTLPSFHHAPSTTPPTTSRFATNYRTYTNSDTTVSSKRSSSTKSPSNSKTKCKSAERSRAWTST